MATNIINTRIKNRLDTLANWQGEGVELLPGEIALVKVNTVQVDETTGNVVNVPAILMKVGDVWDAGDKQGQNKTFAELPWLSAKAADVYDWAKNQYAKDIDVSVVVGDGDKSTTATYKLGEWCATILANSASIVNFDSKLNGLTGTVQEAINAAIEALDSAETPQGSGTFVKSVAQTNGIVSVTMGTISEAELPDISASKIVLTAASGEDPAETLSDRLTSVDASITKLEADYIRVSTDNHLYAGKDGTDYIIFDCGGAVIN